LIKIGKRKTQLLRGGPSSRGCMNTKSKSPLFEETTDSLSMDQKPPITDQKQQGRTQVNFSDLNFSPVLM
jgi:hypothetical protein